MHNENQHQSKKSKIREINLKPEEYDGMLYQNETLKQELLTLARQMDEFVEKQKQAQQDDDIPQNYESKKKHMASMQKYIKENSKIIENLKKQLQQTYDVDRIYEQENKLKLLKAELDNVKDEGYSLAIQGQNQNQVIEDIRDQGKYFDKDQEEKFQELKKNLKKIQAEVKAMEISLAKKDKQLKLLHEQYIVKEEKVKEINKLLQLKQKNPDATKVNFFNQVTEQTIKDLQQQLIKLRAEREVVETTGLAEVAEAEKQKQSLQLELQKKEAILKANEKQNKLNLLKVKEIMRIAKLSQKNEGNAEQTEETTILDSDSDEEEEEQKPQKDRFGRPINNNNLQVKKSPETQIKDQKSPPKNTQPNKNKPMPSVKQDITKPINKESERQQNNDQDSVEEIEDNNDNKIPINNSQKKTEKFVNLDKNKSPQKKPAQNKK